MRGQTTVEFMILVAGVLFFFITALLIFQMQIGEKAVEQRRAAINGLASSVGEELRIAEQASDGYHRTFKVPEKLLNQDYEIMILDGNLFLRTSDGKESLSFYVSNVTGEIRKGQNSIVKENETIYLN